LKRILTTTRHKSRAWDALCLDQSGQEIAEAALVLPLLFLILLAIFWFGRAFNIKSTLQRSAREGIEMASRRTCATCGNTSQANSQVVASMMSALQADHLDPGNVVRDPRPPFSCMATRAPSCSLLPSPLQKVEICTGVPLTCGNAPCQPAAACGANPTLGVRVSFGYHYLSPLPIASLPSITLHSVVQTGSED
jgi:hypothetical protein